MEIYIDVVLEGLIVCTMICCLFSLNETVFLIFVLVIGTVYYVGDKLDEFVL